MNWLDFLLIIIGVIFVMFGLVFLIFGLYEDELGTGLSILIAALTAAFLTSICPFLIVDKGSGSTIGTITSVDKNYFGTTAIYIKTSETNQEEYCIENKKVVEQAKELIGKQVKVNYGERVGLYSTGKCNQAPIEEIELLEVK